MYVVKEGIHIQFKAFRFYTDTVFLASFLRHTRQLPYWASLRKRFQPPRDKTNKMNCAPSKDSDQPGHQPSLIRVFTVRMKKAWVLSYPLSAQQRLWSDWADAQANLNLRWAHSHLVGFVMRRLISQIPYTASTAINPSSSYPIQWNR